MPSCPACPAQVDANATYCTACGASFAEPNLGILESRLTPAQEAAASVPNAVPVVIGLLGVCGAGWGLFAVAAALAKGWPGALGAVLIALVAGVFVFGGYVGVLALRRSPGWLRKNTVFWALQVPVITSPLVSYALACGGFVTAWLQFWPEFRLGLNFLLGSSFTASIFGKAPIVVGVNLLAFAMTGYLLRVQAKSAA
jgi:hypothetical protein